MARRYSEPYHSPNRVVEVRGGVEICREDFEQQSMLAEVPAARVRLAVAPDTGDEKAVRQEAIPIDVGEPTAATLIERGDPVPATTFELVTGISKSVERHGMIPIPIIEDASGTVIDGNARRALERARPDIAFPVFRLNTELSQRERARLRLSLNAMRKQMTASQFALAVALEHRGELRVGPGQRKKNSPVQGYSRDELASRYGITRSLLDAAITVARDGRKSAIESVFDPVKKMDVTTVAKQIKNEQNARELGTTGDPSDLWITPRNILNAVDATFAGDWHDAFTLPSNPAGAPLDEHGNARIYTETNNAFTQPGYERMWANVPFSQLEMSLQWAARHAEAGRQIYLLCPAYTDRPYVQEAIRKANDVLLLRDRLVFGKPRSNGTVEFAAQAMFAVIILGFNVSTQHLIDHGVLGTLVNAPRYEDVAADEEWYEALAAQQQQIDADRASFDEQYRAWVACEVAA